MPKYEIRPRDYGLVTVNDEQRAVLKTEALDRFNPQLLGLGDIKARPQRVPAVCAFLDLVAFTNFTRQVDAGLVVPGFLADFIQFIFDQVVDGAVSNKFDTGVRLRHSLPVVVKFMGDGLLLIWNIEKDPDFTLHNLVHTLLRICDVYRSDFIPERSKRLVDAPPALRCGIARGELMSVGNGNDYIGPCLNIAARIVKLPGVTFACSQRGFDFDNKNLHRDLEIRRITVRGIGDGELIYVLRRELEQLAPEDAALYREP